MKKRIKPIDNQANQKNRNKGIPGTNRQYDQAQGNKGKQMNQSQKGGKKEGKPDTGKMSKEELDLWSNINNPNNDADMNTWADYHNPNN